MLNNMAGYNIADSSKTRNSDQKKDFGHHVNRTQLLVATVTSLGIVIAALIAAKPWSHSNPCTVNLKITSPSAGQQVSGAQGIEVTGAACDMNGMTGWLFDYDLNDEHYYMDFSTSSINNADPIIVSNGNWAYDDRPIGSPGDNDQTYGITAVLASPTCTNMLKNAKPDPEGDIPFKILPAGCQVEDTVDVIVTYPQR
jgi:hypothetical protein